MSVGIPKHRLSPILELYPSAENPHGQSYRPSVTWKLGSPIVSATAAQEATSSDSIETSPIFRRESLSRHQEVRVGTKPQVCFLQPRTAKPLVLFSLMNSSEAATTKFLPKSHLSRVIIRDNLSAQRMFEMEIRAADKTKKKMSYLFDHLKRKFMTDQLRKMNRWKRETQHLQQYLDSIRVYKV